MPAPAAQDRATNAPTVPTAAPVPAPALAPGARRVTRDEVLRLPQSGKSWEFVPLALQFLRTYPDDQQMRFVLANVYARLRLRQPALEQLAAMTEATRAMPQVGALSAQVHQLPESRLEPCRLIAACEQNVTSLAARGIDVAPHLVDWTASLEATEFHAVIGGNIARRSSAGSVDRPWTRLRDDALEARVFPLPHLADPKEPGASIKPYTLEGIDPPWMFMRVYESTPAQKDGYRARIRVVQASVPELLDGLALADLRHQIADERVQWFVGPTASRELASDIAGRLETQVLGPTITLCTVRTHAIPRIDQVLANAAKEQETQHASLEARVRELYHGRTPEFWTARFRDALRGRGAPLRVLIPTCRYSTYIQHSSADLADAFRHAGHEARVLIEPDGFSHLSSIAYLQAIADLEPDAIVLINYSRQKLESTVPPGIPFVSWIQDSMPHQFNAKAGAAMGPLDFLAGHVFRELTTQFGYPRERTLSFPIVVSSRKFHARPAAPELLARHGCEIAYVSHHSETPEAMHARLLTEAGRSTPAARVLQGLWGDVQAIAASAFERSVHHELRDAVRRHASLVLNALPDEQTVTHLMRQYCLPVADRLVRHETLRWAAEIADRRAWRLHLYGRGWDQHPRFARYARGELGHGEELRAAYAAARVHLQATVNTSVHQRVMECAISGGLPICRLNRSVIQLLVTRLCQSLVIHASPDVCSTDGTTLGYSVADSPVAMAVLSQLQRLGVPFPGPMAGRVGVHTHRLGFFQSEETAWTLSVMGLEELVGDLSMSTFTDLASLETLVERAVTDDAWRRAGSELIAGRVRAGLTHDVFARRLLELIAGGGV